MARALCIIWRNALLHYICLLVCKPPSLISVKGRDTMTMLPVVVLFLFDFCGFLFFWGGGINLSTPNLDKVVHFRECRGQTSVHDYKLLGGMHFHIIFVSPRPSVS